MRGIIVTFIVLLGLGYVAVTLDGPVASSCNQTGEEEMVAQWRRTRSGWELRRSWQYANLTPGSPPLAWRIHPALIGTLQLLVSLLVLLCSETTPSVLTPRRET